MSKHDLTPFVFIGLFLVFLAWSVVRGRRWEKYQGEAATRAKTIIDASSSDRDRLNEAISISREQLEVEKQLLSEIKGLRDDLRKSGDSSA
jgi:hypothetical protein